MKRIFIDCTHEYYLGGNTGIQRVVRNIVNNSNKISVAECVPAAWCFGRLVEVKEISSKNEYIRKIHTFVKKFFRILSKDKIGKDEVSPSPRSMLLKKIKRDVLMHVLYLKCMFKPEIRAEKGDIFLFTYINPLIKPRTIEYLHLRDLRIGYIVYDLFPIQFPNFFVAGVAEDFEKIFMRLYKASNFFLGISETVCKDVIDYAKKHGLPPKPGFSFRLGMDLDIKAHEEKRREVMDFFCHKKPYIVVSTIEPRKNHAFILREFELLWRQGIQAPLCIVGKVGWLMDNFVEMVKNHPQYGKLLFMKNDINDSELAYAYEHAQGLITASFVEGFNLPIVEALSRGTPVFASDIPINREVGGKYLTYFTFDEGSLVQALANPIQKQADFKWPSWKESAEELVSRILQLEKTQNL